MLMSTTSSYSPQNLINKLMHIMHRCSPYLLINRQKLVRIDSHQDRPSVCLTEMVRE